MKTIKNISTASALIALSLCSASSAGELVYRPLNPSFGGDPFMGSYLLGKAQAQDTNTDPSARRTQPLSATQRLVQSLESRLISQLIGDISSGELSQGSFDSDDFSVVIEDQAGLINLRIVDKVTGDVTNISVGGLFNP